MIIKILLLANWGLGEEVLKCLLKDKRVKLVGVVTRVENIHDRWSSVVKKRALKSHLSVWEIGLNVSKTIFSNTIEDLIYKTEPDVLLSVSFHKIIPARLLKKVKMGINLHPSKLPKFRGPSPLKWSILCGYKKTGLSFHKMTDILDGGPILTDCEVIIEEHDLPCDIIEKMKKQVKPLVEELIDLLDKENIEGLPQNEEEVTYAPKVISEDFVINWFCPVKVVYNHIRAFDKPYPGALGYIGGRLMRFRNPKIIGKNMAKSPGTLLFSKNDCIWIQVQNGIIYAKVSN